MKFIRNKSFDATFAQIPDIRWFPYVGPKFGTAGRRIMVYAHNIPVRHEEYESRLQKWKDPAYWADAVEEYTYDQGWWTEAFRYFVKAAAALEENYHAESPEEVQNQVDSLVDQIAYLNFIQDLVKSEEPMANATWEQAEMSKRINRKILKILKITHCICWGKPTYEHVRSISGYIAGTDKPEQKRGFSSCVVDAGDGHSFQILRIFHPSMPQGLAPYSETTQKIIADFLKR